MISTFLPSALAPGDGSLLLAIRGMLEHIYLVDGAHKNGSLDRLRYDAVEMPECIV